MDARILFGYRLTVQEKESARDLMAWHAVMSQIKVLDLPVTFFIGQSSTSAPQFYVGVEIPSGWQEGTEIGANVTYAEQLQQTGIISWTQWFDLYHTLHGQRLDASDLHLRCYNETPCLFVSSDVTTTSPRPQPPQ